MSRHLVWLAAVFMACGGVSRGALVLPTAPAATLTLGGEAWDLRHLTDMETIHDVAEDDGVIYVATSAGLWVHNPDELRHATFTPTNAVAVAGGSVFVAAGESIDVLDGAAEDIPSIGVVRDLHADAAGRLWAGGDAGVARRDSAGTWSRFGDAAEVVRFFPGEGDELWVATTNGLWRVAGDTVEEHGARALPAPYVRSVVSVASGRAFALVQSDVHSYLCYYDGARWTHYTLRDFDSPIVALSRAQAYLLVHTESHVISIRDASVERPTGASLLPRHSFLGDDGDSVRVVPLEQSEHGSSLVYDGTGGMPARQQRPLVGRQAPRRLADIPPQHEAPNAPPWTAGATRVRARGAYDAWRIGDRAYVAEASHGLLVLDGTGTNAHVRTGSLIAERDLRLVSDANGPWVLTDDHQLGRWNGAAFDVVAAPAEHEIHALASDEGRIFIACLSEERNVVSTFRRAATEWELVDQRALVIPTPNPEPAAETPEPAGKPNQAPLRRRPFEGTLLVETDPYSEVHLDGRLVGTTPVRARLRPGPHMLRLVAADGQEMRQRITITNGRMLRLQLQFPPSASVPAPTGETVEGLTHLAVRGEEIWVGLRLSDGDASRQRGVAVFRAGDASVTYHHASANAELDGPGALRMPDIFETIDLGDAGNAWFSTLVGAVRLGNSQAVVFGEARGVRGEVVSDVLVAPANKIWLAAAEGPGYYFRQSFEFRMPRDVVAHRPTALALAPSGAIWGAGPTGLTRRVGDEWTVFDEAVLSAASLPEAYVDIEVDGAGRVWALGRRALWVMTEGAPPPAP